MTGLFKTKDDVLLEEMEERNSEWEKHMVATPAEFVRTFGGKRVIEKVLIANNGIAAVKCMRSIRKWAYELFGNEKAIKFVVMVSPDDLKANAEYVRMADHVVPVPGGTNNYNYANCELILDIAKRIPVQAVWAGWGHASENPKLPELLHQHGIQFIGPPEHAMWALGDKIASSILAQSANVPTLPWNGMDLNIPDAQERVAAGECITVPEELYNKGVITSSQEGLEAAKRIGFPVMLKASEGGGGKGIRKVTCEEEWGLAYEQVLAEIPGSPIFVMKLAKRARHIEVQIICDEYGNAISLFGRDCSVQRRHQKIIEEASSIITDPVVFEEMEKAAVRLAKMVGYISAGTVEYLYMEGEGFYFLELNPRLQVEHPCTEMISSIKLPAAQLQVAMGIPLHRIRDVRMMYKESPFGLSPINFENPPNPPKPHGHCLACRITAENPDEGFKPNSGTVQELTFRSNQNVWGYFSVQASGGLHEFADSQFGHCFAWGEDREEARTNMVMALKELSIKSDFRTTVEFLITILETEEFRQNDYDTGWLDSLIVAKKQSERVDTMLAVICASLHIADNAIQSRYSTFRAALERGQVMSLKNLSCIVDVDLCYDNVKYKVQAAQTSPSSYFLDLNNTHLEVDLHRLSDGGQLVSFGGSSYTTHMKEEVARYRVVIGGKTCIFDKDNDPTVVRSTSAGKLMRYLVSNGEHVDAGQAFAEIEVMKMIMPVCVPLSGCVILEQNAGAVLNPGSVLGTLQLDDPSSVKKPELYTGGLPEFDSDGKSGIKLHQIYRTTLTKLENIMAGYTFPTQHFGKILDNSVKTLYSTLKDPSLPLLECEELLSVLSGRIPGKVEAEIHTLLKNYNNHINSIVAQFPGQAIASVLDNYAAKIENKQERDAFYMQTQGITDLVIRYRKGVKGHTKSVLYKILRTYLSHEKYFAGGPYDKCVSKLKEELKGDDITQVLSVIFAHANLENENQLVLKLLDEVTKNGNQMSLLSDELKTILEELANLPGPKYHKVSLKARQFLITAHQPSYEMRFNQIESIFLAAANTEDHVCQAKYHQLITTSIMMFDVLPCLFYHNNPFVKQASLEVYMRRSYIAYTIQTVSQLMLPDNTPMVEWKFFLPQSHPNMLRRAASASSLKRNSTIPKIISISEDLSNYSGSAENCQFERLGVMAAFTSFEHWEANFDNVMYRYAKYQQQQCGTKHGHDQLNSITEEVTMKPQEPIHIINVCIQHPTGSTMDQAEEQEICESFIQTKKHELEDHGIRRVTFLIFNKGNYPFFFTFRHRLHWGEDSIYRHLEPALAFQLDIHRLKNFNIKQLPTNNHILHMYYGTAKNTTGQKVTDNRFFVRSIIRHANFFTKEASFDYMEREGEKYLQESLNGLEVAMSNPQYRRSDCNHIFLNFVPCMVIHPLLVAEKVRQFIIRYGKRLWKLRVLQAELKMRLRETEASPEVNMRFFVNTESGYSIDMHIYKAVEDPHSGLEYLHSFGEIQGPLHGIAVNAPYLTRDFLQQKRCSAQLMETTYVYDFPIMFREAAKMQWEQYLASLGTTKQTMPKELVRYTELVLDKHENLNEIHRVPGQNDVGMIAWLMTIFVPEAPEGRDIIVIANDITYDIGTFGPREDKLYMKASEMARKRGIPRIYISVNSGARIGLADEIKHMFKVAWQDPAHPDKGFKYLYLSPADYKTISSKNSVQAELIEDQGESRYKITTIIGEKDGLGVENLQGSGMIAGETARAYDDIFTLSLVTCRSVGIGSYLVRLGQRVIQVDNSCIILTGASALNMVLGRQVYTSNTQLGGTQIMFNNGVSHHTVKDDYTGVHKIFEWLSYVPKHKGASLPIMPAVDPIDRTIEFQPTKVPYDPRHMVAGHEVDGQWVSGFFDKGSWVECLDNWAKTVVTGRARLGGLPMGVICVETRTVECEEPADPANLDTETKVTQQAGQVWFPDSAFKTAQAIKDFNREELPLIIFANWRGFSGGMRDMYGEILKYGSYIVDGLVEYKRPVFVYIPPFGELRGGAWVVVDSKINPEVMEMFADKDSRGGVLEPEGTVSVKFKQRDIVQTMKRIDPSYKELFETIDNSATSDDDRKDAQTALRHREAYLMPCYHMVTKTFSDLHDTPQRMLAKGVIQEILEWKQARQFFYWKVRRRLLESEYEQKLKSANKSLNRGQMQSMLRRWFIESKGPVQAYQWDSNPAVVEWLTNSEDVATIEENVRIVSKEALLQRIDSIAEDSEDLSLEAVIHLLQKMSVGHQTEVKKMLDSLELPSKTQDAIS